MVVSACALQKTGQATRRRYTTRLVIVLRLGLIYRMFVVDPAKAEERSTSMYVRNHKLEMKTHRAAMYEWTV